MTRRTAVACLLPMLVARCAPVAPPTPPAAASQGGSAVSPGRPVVPIGLDLYVPVPADNPISAAKTELGRRLFFDPQISADGSTACATCHVPQLAFTDGRRQPVGVYGRIGQRNVPSILNRVYGQRFFWDGRAATLEEQVADAMAGETDLGLPPADAASRLRRNETYRTAFARAFGTDARSTSSITSERLIAAIATFVRTQLSGSSDADRFVAGDPTALDDVAREGRALFYGRAGCGRCHAGPLFSDEDFHNTGVAWRAAPGDDSPRAEPQDRGRFDATGRPADLGAFKTPTLREIARTAPYMHDGSLATLEDVVDFYSRGAQPNPHLDRRIRPLNLTEREKTALVAFLRALSGEITEGR